MDAVRTIARHIDLPHSGVAFAMLGISLFALYSNILALGVIPLIWMGYRIGKEMGRQEAQSELTNPVFAPFSSRSNH